MTTFKLFSCSFSLAIALGTTTTCFGQDKAPGRFSIRGGGHDEFLYWRAKPQGPWMRVQYFGKNLLPGTEYYKVLGRTVLDGIPGTLIDAHKGGKNRYEKIGDRTFIPDMGSNPMILRRFVDDTEFGRTYYWEKSGPSMFKVMPYQTTIRQIKAADNRKRAEQARVRTRQAYEADLKKFFEAVRAGRTTEVQNWISKRPSFAGETSKSYPLGEQPLILAVNAKSVQMTKILLKGRISQTTIVRAGLSAAASANEPLFSLLKQRGASVNVRVGGKTPLHLAVENGNKKGAMFLKKHGANLRAEDSRGYTPSEYARLVGNPVLVDLLRP